MRDKEAIAALEGSLAAIEHTLATWPDTPSAAAHLNLRERIYKLEAKYDERREKRAKARISKLAKQYEELSKIDFEDIQRHVAGLSTRIREHARWIDVRLGNIEERLRLEVVPIPDMSDPREARGGK